MSTGEEPYSSGTAQPISTVTEEHSYIYASGMLLRETITSGSTTKTSGAKKRSCLKIETGPPWKT